MFCSLSKNTKKLNQEEIDFITELHGFGCTSINQLAKIASSKFDKKISRHMIIVNCGIVPTKKNKCVYKDVELIWSFD